MKALPTLSARRPQVGVDPQSTAIATLPPKPVQPERFPLRFLASISGVDNATIETWSSRRVFDRPTGDDGKHRRFDFWDCLHLAIIAEMRTIEMQLSGRGTVLAQELLAVAKSFLAWKADVNFVPDRIALYVQPDQADWSMDWQTSPERLPRSYVVLNLRGVVEDVNRRYHRILRGG